MNGIYTSDRLLHFGSLLLVGAWTLAAFAALASLGIDRAQGAGEWAVQFVSWLMPVMGVYGCWVFLRMPHTVVLTQDGDLHFQGVLSRVRVPVDALTTISSGRAGWFISFESSGRTISMLGRINGLFGLLKALHERNPRIRMEGS